MPMVRLKIAVRIFFSIVRFVLQIFVVAITDVSSVTQNLYCTFNALQEIIRQLCCSDLGINSALLFIAAVFSPVHIVDLVQVGSKCVFRDVTCHEMCVLLTFNHHCCTQTYSAVLKLAFLVLLYVAALQTNQICLNIFVWYEVASNTSSIGYCHSHFWPPVLRDMGVYFANKK